VFAYATDPTHFHEWQQDVSDGHAITGPEHLRAWSPQRITGEWVAGGALTLTRCEPGHRTSTLAPQDEEVRGEARRGASHPQRPK
jgi:hypothetical protein